MSETLKGMNDHLASEPHGTWAVPTGALMPYAAVIFELNAVVAGRMIHTDPQVLPGADSFLRRLRDAGVSTGVVTDTRGAAGLVGAADTHGLINVVIDRNYVDERPLPGAPESAVLLEAARRLEAAPGRVAVVADTVEAIRSASAAGFAHVIGIDRTGRRALLEAAGADVVVEDLSQLDLGSLRADPWILTYEGFDPAHEGHREALTTVGNGYFGTRGASPEHRADGVHYPGTYVAGLYNRLTTTIQGRDVEDEHLVNIPNWLPFDLRIADGEWWSDGGLTVVRERRDLDMRAGVLCRHVRLVDRDGRTVAVMQRRFVSMDRPHVAVLETSVTAEGWSGAMGVRSGIDAGVTNSNVAEYADLANHHLTGQTAEQLSDGTLLVQAETTQSRVRIATAVRTTLIGADADEWRLVEPEPASYVQESSITLSDGATVSVEKVVAIVTSKDPAMASPSEGALSELDQAPARCEDLLRDHRDAWSRLWDQCAITVESSAGQDQLVLNLHVFHLLQTVSPHTAGLDAGLSARGLHGEGYRGHVFWDEIFVLPFLLSNTPQVAQSLLEYRWRRLPAARRAASRAGLDGALFPWQSGSDGREQTPSQLFNRRSGRWIPDNSHRQRHVGLAVAYNAWQLYQASGDVNWLAERGADLIIEVARMIRSLSSYDEGEDRYHIAGVMGPDEYHDGPPESPGAGLRDNAYTNVLAAWVCGRAVEVINLLKGHVGDEVGARLHVGAAELDGWEHLSRRVSVPFHDGVISQFQGYDALQEFDWDHYRTTYGNIGRLDLILEAEGDSTNRYKLAKQADVLMLLYIFGIDGVLAQLADLGYDFARQGLLDTVDYYLARTAHGSTLSRVVHASVLASVDPGRGWSIFREALVADLDDTQGGTTEEGIHVGAMAGTIDILMRSIAGMRRVDNELRFAPTLPPELRRLRFRLIHRGQRVDVSLDQQGLRIAALACETAPAVAVTAAGVSAVLSGGETVTCPFHSPTHSHHRGGRPR